MGKKVLAKGDAVRGSLHKETYYGAIEREGEVKYVKRVELSQLEEKNIKYIVDDTVRQIVQEAVDRLGFTEAMASTIWMNEEKQIPIKRYAAIRPKSPNHFISATSGMSLTKSTSANIMW